MANDRETMKADSDFFNKLLDMIPVEQYYGKDVQAALVGKQVKQALKTQGKPVISKQLLAQAKDSSDMVIKRQMKLLKYDPNMRKSVSQVAQENARIEDSDSEDSEDEEESDEEEAEIDDESDSDDDGPPSKKKQKSKNSKKFTNVKNKSVWKKTLPINVAMTTSPAVESARQKLHERLQELKGKRKLTKEEIDRRRDERKGKKKRKQKSKTIVKQDNIVIPTKNLANGTPRPKPIMNKEKIVYSKFDFRDTGEKDKKSTLGGKDYKKLLERVESKKKHMEELKKSNVSKAERLSHKEQWDTALLRASGQKVKDDPALLKKALKNKEQRKEHRKKKWDERKAAVEKRMSDAQDKRKRNIRSRKDSKVKRNIDRAIKKGRVIPGFS